MRSRAQTTVSAPTGDRNDGTYTRGRDLPQDAFTYWPDGTTPPLPDKLLSVFPKRHGTATITWPPERTGIQADG